MDRSRVLRQSNGVDLHIGGRLRLRRQALGLTQEQLAERLHVTSQQVQKYEKGLNRISASRLLDLASMLDVPIKYFFDGLPEVAGSAEAPQDRDPTPDLIAFLATVQGSELNKSFLAIDDAAIQSGILLLKRALAVR